MNLDPEQPGGRWGETGDYDRGDRSSASLGRSVKPHEIPIITDMLILN